MSGAVDLGFARAVARIVGGQADGPGPEATPAAEAVAQAAQAAAAYSRLGEASLVPPPRLVDRAEWVELNLPTIEAVGARLIDRVEGGGNPAAAALGGAAAKLTGAQAGLVLGYASSRILGQYRIALLGELGEAELLLVGGNLEAVAGQFDADPADMLAWVSLHEVTHVLQFRAVDWLQGHLSGLIDTVLSSTRPVLDPQLLRSALRQLIPPDPRRLIAALRDFEPAEAILDEAGRRAFGSLQAAMSLIEGHAEHVMDVAAAGVVADLETLRLGLDRRRLEPTLIESVLQRMFGLRSKARQYAEGRRFVDAVVEAGGVASLNLAWESPKALPSAAEIADPPAWLDRVLRSSPAAHPA